MSFLPPRTEPLSPGLSDLDEVPDPHRSSGEISEISTCSADSGYGSAISTREFGLEECIGSHESLGSTYSHRDSGHTLPPLYRDPSPIQRWYPQPNQHRASSSFSPGLADRMQTNPIKCNQYNAKPDGFQGQYELRRHGEEAHATSPSKAFVCVDISPNKTFLTSCRSCSSSKRYKTKYRAASHLNRVHFGLRQNGEYLNRWVMELKESAIPNLHSCNSTHRPENDVSLMDPLSLRDEQVNLGHREEAFPTIAGHEIPLAQDEVLIEPRADAMLHRVLLHKRQNEAQQPTDSNAKAPFFKTRKEDDRFIVRRSQEEDHIIQADVRLEHANSEFLPPRFPLSCSRSTVEVFESSAKCSSDEDLQSDNTESSNSLPDTQTAMAYVKHILIKTLMREVYSMFDSQWNYNVRSHAGHQSECSLSGSQPGNSSSQKTGKRSLQERESSPPEDDSGRGEKRQRTDPHTKEVGRLLACPFHKYDPDKYGPNSISGTKFRSCIGPGFPSVARLKQHLKRTHRAPIQCQRCWITMPDLQAMARHANEENRCESADPQPEGIDHEKWSLITSSHGATWTKIYEIIFPGAPVPSPYYEPPNSTPDRSTTLPSSPASQESTDFDSYNRRALPLLVEANLQAVVNAEMAPLEESLRAMLVDIVRKCQSTVAQNFQRLYGPKTSSNGSRRSPSLGSVPILQPNLQPAKTSQALHHYQEPPFQSVGAGVSDWTPHPEDCGHSGYTQAPFSDSGYASGVNPDSCNCPCHLFHDLGGALYELPPCQDCALKHFDPGSSMTS